MVRAINQGNSCMAQKFMKWRGDDESDIDKISLTEKENFLFYFYIIKQYYTYHNNIKRLWP